MGFRVLKTAAAVVAAILIAELLGLHTPASAGLLAILGIEVTKKKGLRSALQRIAASMLGLLFGTLLFGMFGYQFWVIGLFVLLVFPILNKMKINEGTVTGSVVMFHLYANETISLPAIWNEILLLLVGLGTATLINIAYMPKSDKSLQACKQRLEQLYSDIFVHIAAHLRDHELVWDGRELLEAEEEVLRGAELAKRSQDNTLLFGGDPYWRVYFYMRGEQLELIHRMADLVAQVYQKLPQGELVAEIFQELSLHVKEDYYNGTAENELFQLDRRYKEMPLPETRGEFEVRAAILQLSRELKHYLSIAKKQKKHRPQPG